MNTEVKNREIMVGRVLALLEQPEFVLPAGGLALVTALGPLKLDLESLGGDQVAADGDASAGVSTRAQTAKALRLSVRTVAGLAGRMDPVLFPGVAEKFRAPKSNSYTALLNAARAIVNEMEPPIRAAFVEKLGQPLFDRIPVLLGQFLANTSQKDVGRGRRSLTTGELKLVSDRALAIVRELDPIVRSATLNEPHLYGAFKAAARVERRRPAPEVPPVGTLAGPTALSVSVAA